MSTEVLVITGGGGVGKTTLSAALAVTAARHGVRTCVVTVDPAKRLADALGVDSLGNHPTAVVNQPDLWAAMLDVSASWEAMVHRHADPDVAARLLEDPFFRALADRFPAAQAYAAGEQMAEHIESHRWDLLVVDTPPAGGGIDFYTAPGRMREMIGGRLLRWLTGASLPGRRTIYRMTARPALKLADAVLGGPLLEEIAEFLMDLRSLHDGLSHRAKAIELHLQQATSIVVTTAYPTPMREARRFFEDLLPEAGRPEVVVFNRQLPPHWANGISLRGAQVDPQTRIALRENLAQWAGEVRRQHDVKQAFATRHELHLAEVPWADTSPTSVDALADLIKNVAELTEFLPTGRAT
jgi:anion-transporting  ArsA/GET3 family ATPase